jgi:hypothetical protein
LLEFANSSPNLALGITLSDSCVSVMMIGDWILVEVGACSAASGAWPPLDEALGCSSGGAGDVPWTEASAGMRSGVWDCCCLYLGLLAVHTWIGCCCCICNCW